MCCPWGWTPQQDTLRAPQEGSPPLCAALDPDPRPTGDLAGGQLFLWLTAASSRTPAIPEPGAGSDCAKWREPSSWGARARGQLSMKVGLVWGQSWRERGAEDALESRRDRAGPSATKHEECAPISQWVLGPFPLRGHRNQGWLWGGSRIELKGSEIGMEVGHTLGWRGMDVLGWRVTMVCDRGCPLCGQRHPDL